MDRKDREIAKLLVDEGRAKLQKIARKTGLPVTTVFNRLKKLESEGRLEIKAKPSLKKLGYGISFYILAKVDTSRGNVDQEKVAKRIAAMKNVLSAAVVTGGTDIVVKGVARDIEELSNIVLREIRGVGGVASTQTLVVLKEEEGDWKKFLV